MPAAPPEDAQEPTSRHNYDVDNNEIKAAQEDDHPDHQHTTRSRRLRLTSQNARFDDISEEDESVERPESKAKSHSISGDAVSTATARSHRKRASFDLENTQPRATVARSVSQDYSGEQHPFEEVSMEDKNHMSVRSTPEDRVSSPEDEERHAIDNYYANNHYTVTGVYSKNSDSLRAGMPEYMAARQRQQAAQAACARSVRSARSAQSAGVPVPNTKFRSSFYWLAHHHKKIGLRHICMLLLVLTYSCIGAAIFVSIEAPNEKEEFDTLMKELNTAIDGIAEDFLLGTNDTIPSQTDIAERVKAAYIQLLNVEGKYKGSTFYKAEDPENNFVWTFASAFFLSHNIYTTVGYGAIAPSTILGQSMVIVYGFIFVPMTLVVIRDLGQWALVHLTKFYGRILLKLRQAKGIVTPENEVISLPIKFAMLVLLVYWIAMTLFVHFFDAIGFPEGSGIDLFHSFYWAFITITTIGFGDLMPSNRPFNPLTCTLFFFGMPIVKVVNRVTYIAVENGVFGTMTVLENRLDEMRGTRKVDDIEEARTVKTPSIAPQPPHLSIENVDAHSIRDEEVPNEWLNNFTVRSIATFMRSRGDVYAGGFGRVDIKKEDLE